MTNEQGKMAKIVDVVVVDGYTIRLSWNDNNTRTIDLEPELYGPIFGPLRDRDLFGRVRIDPDTAATITWPNGADFAPEFLRGDLPLSRRERRAAS